ncbi:HEXXH motif-containing putative peptide modification protein [Streptomyces sp. DSM 42041]|uniref:HEXXH motif-containing putative peptide modification protein n=1 Tax=Streptomyces hazeniae TaxID=3075538 RepID=A0ABU2NRB9_9ACTN|nr:HEXXH motif-containing putative peptide modification protein [Streptomyces sp. DSM 42041]MDT0378168.1 HEXXH motif-containing putative peptide modification protein [Streptomyces sp. DSM 42041]
MSAYDDDLVTVEHLLAAHPEYGDARVITLKATEFYRFALDLLSERSAKVAELADGLRDATGEVPLPLVEDPLVRVTLDEAVSRLEQGFLDESAWTEVVTMLHLVSDAVQEAGRAVPPSAWEAFRGLTVRTGGRDPDPWLWAGGPDGGTPLTRTFLATFERDFLRGIGGDLLRPTERMRRQLDDGFAALGALLPELGASVGAHYVGVGVVDVRTEGETFLAGNVGRIPSVVFFSENRMAHPWRLAETALHEGLHLKLFDIQRSASVFAEPDRLPDGPKVKVPWLKWASMVAPNEWALDRALGAFHVYAHLVLFRRALQTRMTPELVARFGEPEADDPPSLYRFAPERARYLGEEILARGAGALTDHGHDFVTWLLDAVKESARV